MGLEDWSCKLPAWQSLSELTAGPHLYLHVTLFSKGMLALDDDDSGFMLGSWCEGARTAH